jgi:hypothetical protein
MKGEKKNESYEKILDDLINLIGGKEYCLSQLISEGEHRNFLSGYKKDNRQKILDQISEFYDSTVFDENNILDSEITNALWNKYIMKLYFYDQENYKFFVYLLKDQKVEEVMLFMNDSDEEKTYTKSFFSKIKGGNNLWEKYNKILEQKEVEKCVEKVQKDKEFFIKTMKNFKFIEFENATNLELVEASEQYKDGKTRYIYDNKFYYKLVKIEGYVTFYDETDLMLEPAFAKYFYEKIVKQLRDN